MRCPPTSRAVSQSSSARRRLPRPQDQEQPVPSSGSSPSSPRPRVPAAYWPPPSSQRPLRCLPSHSPSSRSCSESTVSSAYSSNPKHQPPALSRTTDLLIVDHVATPVLRDLAIVRPLVPRVAVRVRKRRSVQLPLDPRIELGQTIVPGRDGKRLASRACGEHFPYHAANVLGLGLDHEDDAVPRQS